MGTKNKTETTRPSDQEEHKVHIEEAINEIKFKDRFMIQIINHQTGYRSEPFLANWDELREVLTDSEKEGGPVGKDYILLVAVMRNEETIIPQAPIITIDSFMAMEH